MTLTALDATPGCGVIDHLFNPVVVGWRGKLLHLRGIEPVVTAAGVASFVQEWHVELVTEGGGPREVWMAPGYWAG